MGREDFEYYDESEEDDDSELEGFDPHWFDADDTWFEEP